MFSERMRGLAIDSRSALQIVITGWWQALGLLNSYKILDLENMRLAFT